MKKTFYFVFIALLLRSASLNAELPTVELNEAACLVALKRSVVSKLFMFFGRRRLRERIPEFGSLMPEQSPSFWTTRIQNGSPSKLNLSADVPLQRFTHDNRPYLFATLGFSPDSAIGVRDAFEDINAHARSGRRLQLVGLGLTYNETLESVRVYLVYEDFFASQNEHGTVISAGSMLRHEGIETVPRPVREELRTEFVELVTREPSHSAAQYLYRVTRRADGSSLVETRVVGPTRSPDAAFRGQDPERLILFLNRELSL